MRNGNKIHPRYLLQEGFSSYRTYEEWKPLAPTDSPLRTLRSYRTYEEWKREDVEVTKSGGVSSYRTYEEWKPRYNTCRSNRIIRSYRTYEEWKHLSFG